MENDMSGPLHVPRFCTNCVGRLVGPIKDQRQ